MTYGSVCSGIEAATVAWEPLGWRAAWFSEIEKFPCSVLAHRFPGTPNLGDMNGITAASGPVDLLVGGPPCQSFSIAGLRKGMDDPRGNLTMVYVRLVRDLAPRWVVWENVPGVLSSNGGRDFGSFVGALAELGYGWAYRVLDAQFFGVPQRRRRVFLVGHSGGRVERAAAVLFERESLRGDPASRPEAREGNPRASGPGAAGDCRIFHATGRGWWNPGSGTLTAHEQKDPYILITGPLMSGGRTAGSATHQDAASGLLVPYRSSVRRLTPRECERLQGFPDDFTAVPGAKDGPRYRAIGNSMAVPVMRWIGERIQLVEGMVSQAEAA